MYPRRRRISVPAALATGAGIALLIAIVLFARGNDTPEPGRVDAAPLRLLDDGAGQRHFEVSYPKGSPRGTIIFIHGGGWRAHGPATFETYLDWVNRLTKAGFRVVAISTDESPRLARPGASADGRPALDDVLAFYDQTADAFGAPICSFGISGGGHLAMMLALERDVDCVAAVGSPTDLVRFVEDGELGRNPRSTCRSEPDEIDQSIIGFQIAACYAIATWGESASELRRASPATRWGPGDTDVWAAFELEDPLIAPSQRDALEGAMPQAVIETARPARSGPILAHAGVRPADFKATVDSLVNWLRQVVPDSANEQNGDEGDTLLACNSRLSSGPNWQSARRRDRSELLTSAGLWRPARSSANLIAVNACNGREDSQPAGLQIATPGYPKAAPALVKTGATAAWELRAVEGRELTEHRASFRGFLANPDVWQIGFYARGADGSWKSVASCAAQGCKGLETAEVNRGMAIVPRGTKGDPDRAAKLPMQRFGLDPGTTAIKWELECISVPGCLPSSINPAGNPGAPNPTRPIDPTGRPAVLSLYELETDTAKR